MGYSLEQETIGLISRTARSAKPSPSTWLSSLYSSRIQSIQMMKSRPMAKVTTVRLNEELAEQLDALATSLDRSRSWVIEQAIARYLQEQAWQVGAIQEALDDLNSGQAELVPHEQVMQGLSAQLKAKLG